MWTIAWNINSKPKNFQIWKSCVNFLEKFSGHTHIICKYVKTVSVLLVYCCFSSFPHRLAMILPNKSLKLNKTTAWNAFRFILHTRCPNALEISNTLIHNIFLISHSRECIGSVDGIHFNFFSLFGLWEMLGHCTCGFLEFLEIFIAYIIYDCCLTKKEVHTMAIQEILSQTLFPSQTGWPSKSVCIWQEGNVLGKNLLMLVFFTSSPTSKTEFKILKILRFV